MRHGLRENCLRVIQTTMRDTDYQHNGALVVHNKQEHGVVSFPFSQYADEARPPWWVACGQKRPTTNRDYMRDKAPRALSNLLPHQRDDHGDGGLGP